MQINDTRQPVSSFSSVAGGPSTVVANGAVVELSGHEGQFIKIPNKGSLRLTNGDRRFINLGTGQVLQVPTMTGCNPIDVSLVIEA